MKQLWNGVKWWGKKRDPLSDVANVITIDSAVRGDSNKDATCCQPCRSGSHDEQSPSEASESKSLSTTLDNISTDISTLKDHFVSDASEPAANNEVSTIESELKAANATLNNIDNSVNNLAERFTREAPDNTPGNKTQQANWSLMLLGNIAIDVKRMADQYVGDKLNSSTKDPVFQNIRDTAWLNNTLNGIQDNTNRAVSLLPVQPNSYFNQTNNFTISGAQEPRVVAEAVRDSMPMMGEFSQANQILQARVI